MIIVIQIMTIKLIYIVLASGRNQFAGPLHKKVSGAPYKAIARNVSAFIPPQYVPDSIKFRDPHNMQKTEILAFLHHVKKRQDDLGTADAFQFSHYMKGEHICPAIYRNINPSQSSADHISAAQLAGTQSTAQPFSNHHPAPIPRQGQLAPVSLHYHPAMNPRHHFPALLNHLTPEP